MVPSPHHRVLVIDDDPMICGLIKSYLSCEKYAVDTAENGSTGIEKIDAFNYDLIITDIKMPGISGDQILFHVRNSRNHSLPVIGISGTPWLFENKPFDAVLEKPFSLKTLLYHAQRLIDSDRDSQSPPTRNSDKIQDQPHRAV